VNGGDWVVEALQAEGVRHVFGIPGVHNLPIYDALLRRDGIRHILARHESGAAFMADGYARSSGHPGVVIVTTGPGATNVLTPLAESYASSQPIVVVTSDVASADLGREVGALHEVPNQIDCFRPVTRMAEVVTRASEIPTTIAGAFDLLRTGRPGPVAISIPHDFLFGITAGVVRAGHGRRPPCHVEQVAEAAKRLATARRPLLIAGGGVVSAGAESALVALARRLGAPLITTVMGRGAISERDPLWHSVLPNGRATEPVVREADVILAVGCRFAARSTKGLVLELSFAASQTLIHMDLDPGVIGKLFTPQIGIVGDARDGLVRLLEALGPGTAAATWERAALAETRRATGPGWTAEAARLLEILRDVLPDDGIFVNDQSGVNYWAEWKWPVVRSRTFLYPVGSAVLGYAVPAAIGAQIANPGRAVLAAMGDGGFMFSVNELATAVKYRLPIVFLVVNDERFGAIKWLQERMFAGRFGETDLANPDFVRLAEAFGARGVRVKGLDDLADAIRAGFAADGPTLVELNMVIDPPWTVGPAPTA
jgi:thiamine pyrophosphate-dependent acetolactate synthase large subunit-like protein